MTGPSRLGWVYAFLLFFALGASNAHAVYQYEYTGNTLDVLITGVTVGSISRPGYVSATVLSPTLLTAGSDLTTPGLSLTLFVDVEFPGPFPASLQHPYPFPREPGTFETSVTFGIGAVNAAGLPTVWDISIFDRDFHFRSPQRDIATSNERDSMLRFVDGPFVNNFEGTLMGNPGTWKVSVVPEPESYAMMLAGLGVIGWIARRRRFGIRNHHGGVS